jgi:hypothetical protein
MLPDEMSGGRFTPSMKQRAALPFETFKRAALAAARC